MSAAVDGGCWVYWSFGGTGGSDWQLVGGTSESTPLFAGIVAMADQLAGHRLGDINSDLYFIGEASRVRHLSIGIVDITTGNNSFAGVSGYEATSGYDLASGWGVDGYKFVHTLARL
jgi:subtilase family serine protease